MPEPQPPESDAKAVLLVLVPVLFGSPLILLTIPKENYPAIPFLACAAVFPGLVLCAWSARIRGSRDHWTDRARAFGIIGLSLIVFAACAFALPFAATGALPSSPPVLPGGTEPEVAHRPAPAALTYLKLASLDPRFAPSLMQSLRRQGFRMTDEPSQSAVTLQASATVSIRSLHLVGNTETWKAVSSASLKAIDSRNQQQVFWGMASGTGSSALDPATAVDDAVTNGFDQLISQYKAQYETGKIQAEEK